MSQRARERSSMSLFPFLAVMICTMGALILVLLAMTGKMREHVIAKARAEAAQRELALREATAAAEMPQPAIAAREPEAVNEPDPLPPKQPSVDRAALEAERSRRRAAWEQLVAEKSEEKERRQVHLSNHERELAEARKLLQLAEGELTDVTGRLSALKTEDRQLGETLTILKDRQVQAQEQALKARNNLDELRKRKASAPSAFSVVPFDGSSGTYRRPIYIECTGQGLRFLPEGQMIALSDLDGFSSGYNPLLAGAQSLVDYWLQKNQSDPETNPQPYVLLLVRPSGALSYYGARLMLGKLNTAFGYELIDDEFKLSMPETDPVAKRLVCAAVAETLRTRAHITRGREGKHLPETEVADAAGDVPSVASRRSPANGRQMNAAPTSGKGGETGPQADGRTVRTLPSGQATNQDSTNTGRPAGDSKSAGAGGSGSSMEIARSSPPAGPARPAGLGFERDPSASSDENQDEEPFDSSGKVNGPRRGGGAGRGRSGDVGAGPESAEGGGLGSGIENPGSASGTGSPAGSGDESDPSLPPAIPGDQLPGSAPNAGGGSVGPGPSNEPLNPGLAGGSRGAPRQQALPGKSGKMRTARPGGGASGSGSEVPLDPNAVQTDGTLGELGDAQDGVPEGADSSNGGTPAGTARGQGGGSHRGAASGSTESAPGANNDTTLPDGSPKRLPWLEPQPDELERGGNGSATGGSPGTGAGVPGGSSRPAQGGGGAPGGGMEPLPQQRESWRSPHAPGGEPEEPTFDSSTFGSSPGGSAGGGAAGGSKPRSFGGLPEDESPMGTHRNATRRQVLGQDRGDGSGGRHAHWGGSRSTIGLEQDIRADVYSDRIVVGADRPALGIKLGESREELTERFAHRVDEVVESWGQPPQRFHWIPRIRFVVHPGGNLHYQRMQAPLRDWGVSSTVDYSIEPASPASNVPAEKKVKLKPKPKTVQLPKTLR